MMNMMNRFVEGRGHQREIDMLLELTYACSSAPHFYLSHGLPIHPLPSTVNKSKAGLSAPWVTRRRGPSRV